MKKVYYIPIILVAMITSIALFFAIKNDFGVFKKTSAKKTTEHNAIELKDDKIIKPEDHAPLVLGTDILQQSDSIKIPILMYHHIGIAPEKADATHKGLTVSPTEFATQVEWLSKSGYTAVTLDDLYQFITKKKTDWPNKPIIFTFDDGYSDVFENAVPILKKYKFVGTFGIITGFVGQTQADNFYASWTQIEDAKASGMEVVCHTQNHFDGSNPKFNDEYIYKNLSGCQDDLKSHLGTTEPYLIYPYGHYTDGYIAQARKAGFVLGLTVHFGNRVYDQDLMRIPRIRINPNESLDQFKKILAK